MIVPGLVTSTTGWSVFHLAVWRQVCLLEYFRSGLVTPLLRSVDTAARKEPLSPPLHQHESADCARRDEQGNEGRHTPASQ